MSDITLYHGDCLEIMRGMGGSVDAVITDPPYGIDYRHGESYSPAKKVRTRHVDTKIIGDNSKFDPSPFLKFKTVVLFGANNYASKLPDSRGWIVWNKRSGMRPSDFSDCELAWTNKDQHLRQFEYMWSGVCRQGESGDISLHPTQKPLALMQWIIENYTNEGDTIIDPFMGSGTTMVACVKTGRKGIGIELDKRYYDIACKRVHDAQLQMRLPL